VFLYSILKTLFKRKLKDGRMFTLVTRPLWNCELTKQALEYIWKYGRPELDKITMKMTVKEQIVAGWRRHDRPTEETYK